MIRGGVRQAYTQGSSRHTHFDKERHEGTCQKEHRSDKQQRYGEREACLEERVRE
jgi:hypothetical protein